MIYVPTSWGAKEPKESSKSQGRYEFSGMYRLPSTKLRPLHLPGSEYNLRWWETSQDYRIDQMKFVFGSIGIPDTKHVISP